MKGETTQTTQGRIHDWPDCIQLGWRLWRLKLFIILSCPSTAEEKDKDDLPPLEEVGALGGADASAQHELWCSAVFATFLLTVYVFRFWMFSRDS